MTDVRALPLHAILTRDEIAEYLSVSKRTIERLDLPVTYLTKKS